MDRESRRKGFRRCFVKNDTWVATELESGALPSVGGKEGSEEVARWPRSVPSVEADKGATGMRTRKRQDIAGTCFGRKTPVGTSRSDVKGGTGNEFSS